MDLAQSVILAGIPNAPSVYSLDHSPDLARQRAHQVLKQMVKYDVCSQEDADAIGQDIERTIAQYN